MNIVFWLGVAVAAIGLWYLLSDSFFGIGGGFHDAINNIKNVFNRTDNEEENEE